MPSAAGRLPGPAGALWRHRHLLWQFTKRNIELRHKGSHLGFIWSVLNPLLMLGLYVCVFGYIFGGRFRESPNETTLDYALALLIGLSIHQFFAEILAVAPTVIVANPNFVKKVVFPLEILPAAAVCSALWHMFISLTLVVIGVATIGPGLGFKLLWLPVIVLALVPLALGLAWLLAAAGVFFRDIGQLTGFFSVVLMYASAIFFPFRVIPPAVWAVLRFNPLLLGINLARNAVLWHHPVNLMHLTYLVATGLVCFFLGYAAFRRGAPAFADVL